MKLILQLLCLSLAASLVGCAVHDDHQEDPAPFWWPAFMYKPTTHPSVEEYDQVRGVAPDDAIASLLNPHTALPQRDLRAEWNPIYAEHPIAAAPVADPAATVSNLYPSVGATVYPNRGQAAMAVDSATLYPPTNEFNAGPTRTASIYPRGPLSPTGYLGR